MVKRLGRRKTSCVGLGRVVYAIPSRRVPLQRYAIGESEPLQSHGDLSVAEPTIFPVLGAIQMIPPASALRKVVEAGGRAGCRGCCKNQRGNTEICCFSQPRNVVACTFRPSVQLHSPASSSRPCFRAAEVNSIAAPCASPLRTAPKSSSSAAKAVSRLGSHARRPRPTIV